MPIMDELTRRTTLACSEPQQPESEYRQSPRRRNVVGRRTEDIERGIEGTKLPGSSVHDARNDGQRKGRGVVAGHDRGKLDIRERRRPGQRPINKGADIRDFDALAESRVGKVDIGFCRHCAARDASNRRPPDVILGCMKSVSVKRIVKVPAAGPDTSIELRSSDPKLASPMIGFDVPVEILIEKPPSAPENIT